MNVISVAKVWSVRQNSASSSQCLDSSGRAHRHVLCCLRGGWCGREKQLDALRSPLIVSEGFCLCVELECMEKRITKKLYPCPEYVVIHKWSHGFWYNDGFLYNNCSETWY